MSKKAFTEAAEEIDEIGADWGPLLKSLGTVLTEVWQEQNGEYLSKEERSKRKTPLAQVDQSDIQIRMGDTMLTLVPEEAGKSMVSIPVGFSDKATPATIPREWLAGTFLDGLISIFEGNTEVVWQYVQRINAAIDAAAEVDDSGRMKINTKKLADHKYPVDVAEMLESMKRSYISRSNGSAKVKASFTITKLQQVNPDPEPEPQPSLSMEERLLESAPATPAAVEVAEQVLAESNSKHESSSGEGVVEAVSASPVPSADVASPQEEDAVHDDPTAPSVEEENPFNFKKEPTSWIKHELANHEYEHLFSIEEVAGIAGCHVQTIKRALDKFEAEAAYVHMQGLHTLKDADEGTPGWVALEVPIDDAFQLRIECERSPTGRYARGRPITFTVEGLEEVDEAPTLKAVDDTDPSLSPCPNCGTLADPKDTPEDAPDFVCATCHEVLQDEDEDWAEDTKNRREQLRIYAGTVNDAEQSPAPEEEAPTHQDVPPVQGDEDWEEIEEAPVEEQPPTPTEERIAEMIKKDAPAAPVDEPVEEVVGGLEDTIPMHRLINRGA